MNDKIVFSNSVKTDEFFSRHSLYWDRFPHDWDEGSFIGSGFVGASIYHDEKNNLILKLGHTKIFDNRPASKNEKNRLFLNARLPIGYFKLQFQNKPTECYEKLDILKAEASGTVEADSGSYTYKAFCPHGRETVILEYCYQNKSPEIDFVPFEAVSPRQAHMIDIDDENRKSKDYPPPKSAEDITKDGISFHIQPLFSGGAFATAYKKVVLPSGAIRLIITVKQNADKESLIKDCADEINYVINNYDGVLLSHIKEWESFYSKSFLSISAAEFESFYYIQLYKLFSAGTYDGLPYDTCAVWLYEKTMWPAAWWNLNVQLSYSPLYKSNHPDLAHSLTDAIHNGMNELKNNVPEKYRADCCALGRATCSNLTAPIAEPGSDAPDEELELGNLTWALFYCWQEYKMSNDKTILTDTVYPALKGAMQYYLYFLYPDKYGVLHLPRTASPEYIGVKGGDCCYDSALMKWGFKTLIEICEILGIKDEKEKEWRYALEHLADYPHDDKEGFYISSQTKYEKSHRHYSHLLMIYPLHLLDLNDKAQRTLAETSIYFWQSKPEALLGYSQTGAASMRAMLGDGNAALKHLKNLWKGFLRPNTMYKEGENPVLETPLAAATSILDMIIESYEGYINIFPAVPDEWRDIAFDGLLTYGGYEVGACMKDGKPEWIKIKAHRDGKCLIKAPIQLNGLMCSGEYKLTDVGMFEFNLKDGEEIILSTKKEITLQPVKGDGELYNCYGLNARNDRLTSK